VLESSVFDAERRLQDDTACDAGNGGVDLRNWRVVHSKIGSIVVSLMAANNEVGVLFPVGDAARLRMTTARSFLHLTQAAGKIPIDVHALGIDLAVFSSQDLRSKGVGLFFIRAATEDRTGNRSIIGAGKNGLRGVL